jgi:hypothetical protein
MAMVQRPSAVGLTLCRLVIVEEKTRNVTLASTFQRLEFEGFPATAEPFCAYAVLTDGLGDLALDLIVSRCDTLEEVYTRSFQATFKDPLRQLRLWWRVRSCSFPVPARTNSPCEPAAKPLPKASLRLSRKERIMPSQQPQPVHEGGYFSSDCDILEIREEDTKPGPKLSEQERKRLAEKYRGKLPPQPPPQER